MRNQETRRSQPATALTDVIDKLPVMRGTDAPSYKPLIRPQWLEAKFGYGHQPARRKAFYRWLSALVSQEGREFEKMVKSVARSAESADDPGNYFVAVVMRRGREMGFIRDRS